MDDDLVRLIAHLEQVLGRWPTEDEIYHFIFGDDETREKIFHGEWRPDVAKEEV